MPSPRLRIRLLVATCCWFAFGSVVFGGCSGEDPAPPPLPVDETTLARGEELVTGLAACGFCHGSKPVPGAPLSGGRVMADLYGEVVGPNLTSHPTGLRAWNDDDFLSAFRAFTAPDERTLSRELHGGYEWLSDYDLSAIVAYVRRLPPVPDSSEKRDLSFIDRNTTGLLDSRPEVRGYVPRVPETFKVEYGQYLTDHVARCASCHSKPATTLEDDVYMAGGRDVAFEGKVKTAPNITSSKAAGVGSWSIEHITAFLQKGTRPDGRRVDSRFCPVDFFARASDRDRQAVAAYVKSIPPVE